MTANATNSINPTPAQALRIYVLGRFEIEQGRRSILSEQWRSGKARSLFKILLTRRGYQISRLEAAELLWPELDQDRAANNLNQAVYSLRRTLEPNLERAGNSLYLKTEGTKIQLNAALIGWVDMDEFKRLHRQAQITADPELYEQAAGLYSGDYLPEDLYEDWSVFRRETLRQEWIEMMQRMAALYQLLGQDEKYRQCLHRVLEADFSHEETVQKLMLALNEAGRREEALLLYRSFSNKLLTRLKVEPLPETLQLFHEISAGRAAMRPGNGLRPAAPPGDDLGQFRTTAVNFQSGLPANLRTINRARATHPLSNPAGAERIVITVGRSAEQAAWQQSLQDALGGRGRFTLLVGEPGAGKSFLLERLAEQASQAGFMALQASCFAEQAEWQPGPLGNLLQQAFDRLENAELEECLRFCNPAIYSLLPGLGHRLEGQAAGETGQTAIYAAAGQALVWLARRCPLVLVLDDLHNLSGPNLRMLQHLLTHNSLRSLVVLAAARPGAGHTRPSEFHRLLHWAEETGQTIRCLARFSRPEIGQLLAARLGQPPATGLLETCFNSSQGNPRLAVELAQTWSQAGQLWLVGGEWDLRENWNGELTAPLITYIQRVAGALSRNAQVLLALASLSSAGFSFETLRRIVQQRPDGGGWWIELDKNQLGQTLLELTGGGLIKEQGSDYYFAYPLLAQAIAAAMSHNQRRCWQDVIAWAATEGQNNHREKVEL